MIRPIKDHRIFASLAQREKTASHFGRVTVQFWPIVWQAVQNFLASRNEWLSLFGFIQAQ
jgi:hypothetical protein